MLRQRLEKEQRCLWRHQPKTPPKGKDLLLMRRDVWCSEHRSHELLCMETTHDATRRVLLSVARWRALNLVPIRACHAIDPDVFEPDRRTLHAIAQTSSDTDAGARADRTKCADARHDVEQLRIVELHADETETVSAKLIGHARRRGFRSARGDSGKDTVGFSRNVTQQRRVFSLRCGQHHDARECALRVEILGKSLPNRRETIRDKNDNSAAEVICANFRRPFERCRRKEIKRAEICRTVRCEATREEADDFVTLCGRVCVREIDPFFEI